MSERSLFNVACKILGLWVIYGGLTSLIWAFLASRFADRVTIQFNPSEFDSWFFGGAQTVCGLLLCGRSSWLTRLLFGIDGPLDSRDNAVLEDDKKHRPDNL